MSKSEYRLGSLGWAAAFVFFGVVLLLFNLAAFGQYEVVARLVLAALFGAGASGFFLGYFANRQEWARLMPAWTLLALALMVMTSAWETIDQAVIAAILFIGLAAAFVNIYLLRRDEHWWALIPGGFMLVLGIVIALSSRIAHPETLGSLIFVGMGAVFFVLYWLAGARRQWWALVPGTVLSVFGLLLVTGGIRAPGDQETGGLARGWPLLLIVIGLTIGVLGARRSPRTQLRVEGAPKPATSKTVGARPPGSQPSGRTHDRSDEPPRAALGDYVQPAPGATVEILSDPDE